MRKIIFLAIFAIACTNIHADKFSVYTQAGLHVLSTGALETYRFTGVTADIDNIPVGMKFQQKVYNGMFLTGAIDNYTFTLDAYKYFTLEGINIAPSLGINLSNSSNVGRSFGLNAGFNADIPLKGMFFDLTAGTEMLFYSDSSVLDYYGGFKLGILPKLDLLLIYSGFYSNNNHMFGGGLKLTFGF